MIDRQVALHAPVTGADDVVICVYRSDVAEALQALEDDDWQVRAAAAAALDEIGPGAVGAVSALVRALEQDPMDDVRVAAAQALGRIGSGAAGAIAALAWAMERDGSAYVRWVAASALRVIVGT